ncbi:hypothetical protein [Candidatus Poriferisodalis sp.]|uniref:hypothetical protein n=1 Tax=Candidatus Poriferisodalis sp. TaxID=3101277 RepID=UPI003B02A443
MKLLWTRAASASAALLISGAAVSGCGDDGTVTQQPAATAAETDSQAAPATTAAPTDTASGDADSTADAAAPTTAAAAAAVETRAEILQLEGALLDGQQFDFALTAGNDVLLWFWAPW